ncbi:MAG: OmpA family protein [Candidatus Methylumidiphilus sp.]
MQFHNTLPTRILCVSILVVMQYTVAIGAEDVYSVDHPPSAEGLYKQLKLPEPDPDIKVRYIPKQPRTNLLPSADEHTSASFLIPFENKETSLKEDVQVKLLAPLAESLKRLPDQQVILEGHANRTGTPRDNWKRSKKRAEAVKQFLVASHAMRDSDIKIVPKGDSAPLEGSNPEDDVNRRVTIISYRK